MIRNLLIDLGGVVMEIRRINCVNAFKALGFDDVDTYLTDYAQSGPFEELEEGRISPAEFRNKLRRLIPAGVSDAQIDDAFQQFLVGIPSERLDSLLRFRAQGLHVYMLSNTNHIMWNGKILSEFAKQGLSLDSYFDDTLTSFEAKAQKPSPAIFKLAERKFAIIPEQTLFIDDSQRNLDTAASLGFHTLLVPPDADFATLVDNYRK